MKLSRPRPVKVEKKRSTHLPSIKLYSKMELKTNAQKLSKGKSKSRLRQQQSSVLDEKDKYHIDNKGWNHNTDPDDLIWRRKPKRQPSADKRSKQKTERSVN